MSRLIDADALKDHIKIFDIGCGCSEDYQKSFLNAIDEQPTIEPEPCEDAVSRQAAIDAALEDVSDKRTHEFNAGATRTANRIKQLPSAQQVLTCKGCKYDYYEYAGCLNCLRRERDLYEPE